MSVRALQAAVLVISGAGIAYQVALMRVFAVAQWHHFAYMIISLAMLGFGASGALLAVIRPHIAGREAAWLRATAFLLPLAMIGCYALSQRVPFETLQIVADRRQAGWLLVLYLLLMVPFFLVSTGATLAFFLAPRIVGRLYFFNLFGSGLGAVATTGLLYVALPRAVPYILAAAASLAFLALTLDTKRVRWIAVVLTAGLAVWAALGPHAAIRVSEFKSLSYARLLPDAKVIEERYSPLSVLTAVESSLIRETPGQIAATYPMSEHGELPPQIGLYFDAGTVSPVSRFDGDLRPFTYLDYVTSAVAYRLVEKPRVFVMGAGGGQDVLGALWHGAAHVTALDVDPNVFALVNGPLAAFSGELYRRPSVVPVVAEGRGYLESHDETYDLIQLPLFGSMNASAAGVHALSEGYLYTREAFALYLRRLTPGGVLVVNCWLKMPATEAIKLIATAVEAGRDAGMPDPGRHLAFIRSWNNGTLLLSRSPLTDEQIAAVRAFCEDRGFDIDYLSGIRAEETNRFTILERPVYYEAATALLSAERERFYEDYLFHVRPATDDRPYFFRFFKWDTLPRLLREMGTTWVPFVEWGYLVLVATLAQSLIASAVLILLPLAVLARRIAGTGARGWVFTYFAALGAAYMFLEIAFIQRFMLFLAYPVYAVAVVLTAFLVFSGLGSLFAGRARVAPERLVLGAVVAIALFAACYHFGLPELFRRAAGWHDALKVFLSVGLLAPIAFAMGIPFPTGLQVVSDRYEALLPWAWGINGCASVVGANLATLAGVHLGFRWAMLLAVLAYFLAAGTFLVRHHRHSPIPPGVSA